MAAPMPDSPMVIPGWFIKVLGAVGALAVPWAAWVTMTLATMNVKLDLASKADEKVERVEARFREHVADSNLHSAAFAKVNATVEALTHRIERLEERTTP